MTPNQTEIIIKIRNVSANVKQ